MPETCLPERAIDVARRATAALAVCGLLSGHGVASVHEPEPVAVAVPDRPADSMPVEPNVYYGPQVTPLVSKIMGDNVVLLTETNCSGFLVRNQHGKAIGALTAKHCGVGGQR